MMLQNDPYADTTDEFATSSPFLIFPKLLTKFKGKHWTFETAREQLQIIMGLVMEE